MKHLLLSLLATFGFAIASCQQPGSAVSESLTPKEFSAKISEANTLLLDVRTPEEYASGHLDGAININYNDPGFADAISKLDHSKTALVYCLSGGRSGSSVAILSKAGFSKIYNLTGGIMKWSAEGLPLVKADSLLTESNGLSLQEYQALANTAPIVIIDFNATWCMPCKKLAPILERIESENKGKLKVIKVDVDKNRSLATTKKIDGIPFLEIYKDGKLTMQHEGLVSYEDLMKLLPL